MEQNNWKTKYGEHLFGFFFFGKVVFPIHFPFFSTLFPNGTRVDGVYDSDPEKNDNAIQYDTISFSDVLKKNLKIMDSTAFTLSQVNNLPIIVFNMNKTSNLLKLIKGKKIGTSIKN